ncbi:mucoidy inhibitor MuiA family protein [Thiohalorhabdus methylotrophus]|uniref:Mucoidy inhibitor MuiA family protein n=1 Tax=Thiohalorhabdus methylotrophus TaxID=3242694 RepID=A0ABV4TY27_9GAMM
MRLRLVMLAIAWGIPALSGGSVRAVTPLDTAIRAVTVYPNDQARIHRSAEVDLQAGARELVVGDLPAQLVRSSVRAEVSGAQAAVRVGTVEVDRQPVSGPPRERERQLRAKLERLQADRVAVTDRMETARTQLTFVEGLAELPEREGAGSALTGGGAAERWPELWRRIGEGARQARKVMREARREQERLQAEIEAVRDSLEQLGQGEKARIRIRIGLEADAATRAELSLRYRVRGAEWRPEYEAHLDTNGGAVQLVRKARVRQRTGKDWSGIRLALATVAPVSGSYPELPIWWVDFGQPRPLAGKADGARAREAAPPISGGKEARSRTVHGAFTPTYRVSGAVTVPGANQPRTVVLGRRQLASEMAVRVVPQRSERAWMTARVTWNGQGALPPGRVSRYRDGSFVGRGRWSAWAPGDARHLAFGIDPRFEVAFRPVTDLAGEDGLISKRSVRTRHYRIELTNRHQRPLEGSVRFRVPVPRDEEITVEPWFPEEPDRSDVDSRRGIHAWERTIPAGGTVVLKAGYRLSTPEGKSVPGF